MIIEPHKGELYKQSQLTSYIWLARVAGLKLLIESHMCEVQAESWKFREPYLGLQVAEGLDKLLVENPNFHYPDKFIISSPNSDVT